MSENKGFYEVYSYNDKLKPGDQLTIEHSIYISDANTDISKFMSLSLERLAMMKIESVATEQAIFQKLRSAIAEWEVQAAQTQLLDKAIEYLKTPAVKHTSNQWVKDSEYNDARSISNMVYKMYYNVYEDTKYDRAAQQLIPVAWYLTWNVHTMSSGWGSVNIDGQIRKRFTDKSSMEKYLDGRIKAYAKLFTEISPPIPQGYADFFRISGRLLPGYTIQA